MSQDIPGSKYIESPDSSGYESDSLVDPDAQLQEAAETLKNTLLNTLNGNDPKFLDDDKNLKDTIYAFKYNDIGSVIPYPHNWTHQLLGVTISIFPDEWIQWLEDNYGRVYDQLTEGFEEFF